MANNIQSFAQKQSSENFHVEPLPKLGELMMQYGFKEGATKFDQEMERWRQTLERQINERIVKAQALSSGNP